MPGGRGFVRCPGSLENAGGKGSGFDSRRGASVQHILLDIAADEDDEYAEDHKGDENNEDEDEGEDEGEEDTDDDDEIEDEDDFEDSKG